MEEWEGVGGEYVHGGGRIMKDRKVVEEEKLHGNLGRRKGGRTARRGSLVA